MTKGEEIEDDEEMEKFVPFDPSRIRLLLCDECNSIAGIIQPDFDNIRVPLIIEHLKECESNNMNLQVISMPKEILAELVEEFLEERLKQEPKNETGAPRLSDSQIEALKNGQPVKLS